MYLASTRLFALGAKLRSSTFHRVKAHINVLLVLLGLGGVLFFGQMVWAGPVINAPDSAANGQAMASKSMHVSAPKSLTVESLGIQADVQALGLNGDGSLQTPSNAHDVAWYKFSPTPGQKGPAVLSGHVVTGEEYGVFWKLNKLKAGDVISVTRQDGSIAKFRTYAIEQFDQQHFPSKKVYGDVAGAELRLITCSGAYDRATDRFSHNTIVFAELL